MASRGVLTRFLAPLAAAALLAGDSAGTDSAAGGGVKAAIERAWDYFRVGEFGQAALVFEGAAARAGTDGELRMQALYGLATTCALRSPGPEPEKAALLYEEIVSKSGDGDLAAWSMLGLARMMHAVPVGQEPDYGEVRAAYQRVIDKFPSHPAAEQAFIHQQSTLVATLSEKDAAAALAALEGFVQARSGSRFASPAYSLISECHRTLGRPTERLAAEIRALETRILDPSNPYMDLAWPYWKIATIAEFEAGDFAVARKYYGKLIEEYPTDIRKYGARQALQRMSDTESRLRAGSR